MPSILEALCCEIIRVLESRVYVGEKLQVDEITIKISL